MSLRAFLHNAATALTAQKVDSPRLSAEVLLAHALGLERPDFLKRLITEPDTSLPPPAQAIAEALLARRAQGEPVAYLVGSKEFYGRDFAVNPATLIPRPETELLVDLALERAGILEKEAKTTAGAGPLLFADLGTGSGCIAITLALELPTWKGLAIDLSMDALRVARTNAYTHKTHNLGLARATFTLPLFTPHSLAMLVSNPPYISADALPTLSPEVREFEPHTALVPMAPAGTTANGLEHIRLIVQHAAAALHHGGILLMEIGYDQGQAALALCSAPPWHHAAIHRDLAGHDRVLVASLC